MNDTDRIIMDDPNQDDVCSEDHRAAARRWFLEEMPPRLSANDNLKPFRFGGFPLGFTISLGLWGIIGLVIWMVVG